MLIDDEACYRALAAHDARFDGTFFVGVSTTGIYCRPVCPARTPRRDRCTFFSNAASAERAGYRPCLRCRPEAAPGRSSVDAVETWATHVVRRIEDGALMDMCLGDLAKELGISDRHLRRTVRRQFGVSPVELAQTQRLLAAKRLLVDTALPVSEVAAAAGFDSLRRFNALFKARYGLVPTSLRRSRSDVREDISCEVGFRPPFDWASLLGFLAPRASGGVESALEGVYRRTVELRGRSGWISVAPVSGRSSLKVAISSSLAAVVPEVLVRVKRLFDLAADPADIAARLGALAEARPGLRVPGAFDGFEVAVRAIIGQQVSVRGATVIAGRFTEAFGEPFSTPWPDLDRLTPTATRVAQLDVSDVASVGIIRSRARAILALADAVASKSIVLAPGSNVQETTRALRALPGTGEWTAEYIAMRCLSWPDAFPHTDLALRKALQGRPEISTDAWRPWRAYAAMHLWKSLETPV
jgi:AraC family transcriptional regulator of adaptative response / DNA-3-methyladenine glycosylase II